MNTRPWTLEDLSASVLAVPPLARRRDLSLDETANQALVRHIEAGGIRTLLYGGNANLYHVGVAEYPALLDLVAEAAGPHTRVIPSVGPDFGKMMEQAKPLAARAFATAMVLPHGGPTTVDGVATGIRRFAEAFGRPVVLYLKADNYLTAAAVKALVEDGLVAAIKYAIVRPDPREDRFLSQLADLVDRKLVVSGLGERPAVIHLRDFGLAGFTTGSGCVAPRGSQLILQACQARDYRRAEALRAAYLPLEDLRDEHSPIRVLHEAVTLAGIADMGAVLPLLSNLEAAHHPPVRRAATALWEHDRTLPAA